MELFSIPENPAPPGAIVSAITARDGINLRAAHWSCEGECAGTIAILPGRAEFIEKYFEVIGELLSRNFDVAILDWRGQGRSARLASDPHKGHVGNFRAYQRDLDAFAGEVLAPFCRPPWFALGHSMGAAIALAKTHTGRSPFARLVLTSPMIDLCGLRFRRALRIFARLLVVLGQGRRFVPGGGAAPYMSASFDGNILTSDPSRHARSAKVIEMAPYLAIGDPTIGWINAAFRLMRRFEDVEFPRRLLTPVLILAAGDDHVVNSTATDEFSSRLKAGKCIMVPRARHEILMEADPLREIFWAAFDAFLPGEGMLRNDAGGAMRAVLPSPAARAP
ncbi:MAG: alpha/beta hydrolase [Beijerinckiaceae bacterium]|nr:alpha/beta hydrolase [Beijerinckiaceae bacterium]MCI0735918.1 alpha/beta hydrolase [Beijerinckiaceae bacterium]